jgi:hypothetical protein
VNLSEEKKKNKKKKNKIKIFFFEQPWSTAKCSKGSNSAIICSKNSFGLVDELSPFMGERESKPSFRRRGKKQKKKDEQTKKRKGMSARSEALRLYSHLIRIAKRWPMEEDRMGRVLKPVILQRIRADFARCKTLRDENEIKKALDFGKGELGSLKKMLDNEYMNAVRCSLDFLFFYFYFFGLSTHSKTNQNQFPIRAAPIPEVVKKSKKLLSNRMQNKQHTREGGKLFKLVRLLLGQPPKSN